MKFAHLADCHIGSWRDPKLRDASTLAFGKAIDKCVEENVDFILVAGDLFNTSLPSIDGLIDLLFHLIISPLQRVGISNGKRFKDSSILFWEIQSSNNWPRKVVGCTYFCCEEKGW